MAARRFFAQAISATEVTPMEVTTDQAPAYPAVLDDLLPAARPALSNMATTALRLITAD
jgi:hypothetical protein